jgi:hypothetical protein
MTIERSLADGLGPTPEQIVRSFQFGSVQDGCDDGISLPIKIFLYPSEIIVFETRDVDHGELFGGHSCTCTRTRAVHGHVIVTANIVVQIQTRQSTRTFVVAAAI